MLAKTDAVLLLAHGTLRDLSEMPAFLTSIRRGRPPSEALVAEMRERYARIGGSPHLEITQRQAQALAGVLGIRCEVGMRLWHPRVEERLTQLAAEGVQRVCLLPLAPFSVEVYVQAALEAQASLTGAARELRLVGIESYADHPGFIAAVAELIRRKLPREMPLVLTAHSLPMHVIRSGDAYGTLVERAKRAVDERLGRSTWLAYQSQGADGGEWLGPTLRSALESVAATGAREVAIAPFGFLSDHVETLYDLDIEAAAWCTELGLTLTRVPALNDDAAFIRCLAEIAQAALG